MLTKLSALTARIHQSCYPWGKPCDFWLGIISSSLLINILALVFPISVMQIYHHIVPNNDFSGLLTISIVLIIAMSLENILRLARHTIANWADAKLTLTDNVSAFKQFSASHLSDYQKQQNAIKLPNMTDTCFKAQNRLRLINLPFLMTYFAFLAYINFWLCLIPLITLAIFLPLARSFSGKKSSNKHLQNFIYQSLSRNFDAKQQPLLLIKFEQLEKATAIANYREQIDTHSMRAILTFGTFLCLLGVACLGTFFVLNNNLTPGALAASLILAMQFLRGVMTSGAPTTESATPITAQLELKNGNIITSSQTNLSTHITSPFNCCVEPLLTALHENKAVAELQPQAQYEMSLYDLKKMMQHLGYSLQTFSINLDLLDARLLPGIYITPEQKIYLLLEKNAEGFKAFDPTNRQIINLTTLNARGQFNLFKKTIDVSSKDTETHWLLQATQPIRKFLFFTLSINFINSLLLLSLPLFLILLYDHIVRTQAISMLVSFTIGTFLAVLGFFSLQWLNAHFTSLTNVKLLNIFHYKAYQRLLRQSRKEENLQDLSTELQDFINLGKFFKGPLLSNVLKLPFVIFAFIMLAMLASKIYLVTLVAIFILFLLIFFTSNQMHQHIIQYHFSEIEQQKLILSATLNMNPDQQQHQDFHSLSAQKSMSSYRLNFLNQCITTISSIIIFLALIFTLAVGTTEVINGSLTLGSLLACLLLNWMILLPIRQIISRLADVLRFKNTWQRFNRLMSDKPETTQSMTTYKGEL